MPSIPKSSRIAIVGGGPGGLTLANLLQQEGFEKITVLERWREIKSRGGHIGIMPADIGGALPVMEALGLKKKMAEFTASDGNFKTISNGRVVMDMRRPMGARIMRETLQQILLDKLRPGTVQFGKAISSFEEREEHVELLFDDGTREAFDLVVASDGINSTIAEQLYPDFGKKFSGFVTYACLARGEYLPDAYYDHHVHGDGHGMSVRCVKGFGSDGRWDAAYFTMRTDIERSNDWDAEGTHDEIEKAFEDMQKHVEGGCPDWLRELVANSERVMRWGIYENEPKPTWISPGGKVALLGDAAHAMAPYLGQGAQCAIVDSHVLATELLRDQKLADALATYEAQRKPHCERIIRAANLEGLTITSFGVAAAYHKATQTFKKILHYVFLPSPKKMVSNSAKGLLALLELGFHASEGMNTFLGVGASTEEAKEA